MYGLRILELTFHLTFITVCETSIKWDIKGEYLIYGQDATLTCDGTSCPSKAIKKWIGGPNYNLLCFDDYSTKPTKYKMMSNHTRPEFNLMIKGFNFSDANCEYTCSCGFLQYTNMLKLNDLNFIYLPDVDEDSSKQKDDSFKIELLMKVFPIPKCELFYEGNALPVNITVIKELTWSDLELYTVRIHHTIDLKTYKCKGDLNLTCQVRSLRQQLLYHKIDFCEHEHPAIYIIIISVFGSLSGSVLSATIAFIIYRLVKAKRSISGPENLRDIFQGEVLQEETSNKKEETVMISFSSNKIEEILMLNLPSNEEETIPMFELPSKEADETSTINVHEESNSAKYEHFSIAKHTQIREDENG